MKLKSILVAGLFMVMAAVGMGEQKVICCTEQAFSVDSEKRLYESPGLQALLREGWVVKQIFCSRAYSSSLIIILLERPDPEPETRVN